ncbi:MAG: hypothetical protein KBG51_05380, partial [Flavonifractor sp.]|nr:hypothetical protein [Flavonifractor sp.]
MRQPSLLRRYILFFCGVLCAALGIALILMLIGLFFARPLGTLLGADETVIDMTAPYLQVLLL